LPGKVAYFFKRGDDDMTIGKRIEALEDKVKYAKDDIDLIAYITPGDDDQFFKIDKKTGEKVQINEHEFYRLERNHIKKGKSENIRIVYVDADGQEVKPHNSRYGGG